MHCPASGKLCYQNLESAQGMIEMARKKEHPSRFAKLKLYYCHACGWFHLGHDYGPKTERRIRRGKNRRVVAES